LLFIQFLAKLFASDNLREVALPQGVTEWRKQYKKTQKGGWLVGV